MKLLTKKITEALLAQAGTDNQQPVVKFFTPDAGATWLIASMEEPRRGPDGKVIDALLFGLCDLGLGFPELGWVSLRELTELRGPLGLPVERDLHWSPKKSLGEYAAEAATERRIVA
jgi:hypothetical protein